MAEARGIERVRLVWWVQGGVGYAYVWQEVVYLVTRHRRHRAATGNGGRQRWSSHIKPRGEFSFSLLGERAEVVHPRESMRTIHSAWRFRTSRISNSPYNTACAADRKSRESKASAGNDVPGRKERMEVRISTGKGEICDSDLGGQYGERGRTCPRHAYFSFVCSSIVGQVQIHISSIDDLLDGTDALIFFYQYGTDSFRPSLQRLQDGRHLLLQPFSRFDW
ncbi:hypothetical protein EDD85DRAFT_976135 [Armillaria nabsnona]|nr:hypothetical protein EDD85DRAFT_976135 [Armillaria nabsnona]